MAREFIAYNDKGDAVVEKIVVRRNETLEQFSAEYPRIAVTLAAGTVPATLSTRSSREIPASAFQNFSGSRSISGRLRSSTGACSALSSRISHSSAVSKRCAGLRSMARSSMPSIQAGRSGW